MAGFNAAVLVGFSEEDAKRVIDGNGLLWRVITRDGKPMIATRDVRKDRVTMKIEKNVVTEAYVE